jgi:RNA polymerase sigma-70 factor (ECF subfamily)
MIGFGGAMSGFESEQDFQRLAEPYRRELQALCYRMMGSFHDAEDLVQETFARAWGRRTGFEGRSSLRTWLYRIATNACLDALEKRPARTLPGFTEEKSDPGRPLPPPTEEANWLTPAPDALFTEPSGPDARYSLRESVALAFLAALQHLAPRQRVVLLLRDVLGWQAAEAAELLEMTVVAVNSALQRARATLEELRDRPGAGVTAPRDAATRSLLERYMRAWEEADLSGLIALLREDASYAMPPLPCCYRGRADVEAFIRNVLLAGDARGRYRVRAVQANAVPALAMYQLEPDGTYAGRAIQVLEVEGDRIVGVNAFLDVELFAAFGLPPKIG